MKKYAVIGATTLGVASVALASTAMAGGLNYKVVVGTATSGNHSITAASTGSQTLGINNNNAQVICSSASVPSSSFVTAAASVLDVATINGISYTGCNGPGGNLTVAPTNGWKLHGTTAATSGSSDVISGHIENISARVFFQSNPTVCDFTVAGTARGKYTESSTNVSTLEVNEAGDSAGQLKVVGTVKGCLGKIKTGDIASYKGTFRVTSADGAIKVG